MKLSRIIKSKFKDQRGAVAVIVAVSMAMLIGFLALAIDVGYLYATKNELQNIADSAALAGAGALGNYYANTDDPFTSDNRNIVVTAVEDVVGQGKNTAGGGNFEFEIDVVNDLFIYNFNDHGNRYDDNDYDNPDAVRVIARRDSFFNGQISTFFAKIFNIDLLPVTADATAALTGKAKVEKGGLPVPIGISKARFDIEYCNKRIKFYPTGDPTACAGWTTFDNVEKLKQDIFPGLIADPPTYESPELGVGDEVYFTGGTVTNIFTELKELFDKNKGKNDGTIDLDDDPDTWTTDVIVYDWDDCSNPNTWIDIKGFAAIRIFGVTDANSTPRTFDHPDLEIPGEDYPVVIPNGTKAIVATMACELYEPARGGGGEFGVMGTIPGLVE